MKSDCQLIFLNLVIFDLSKHPVTVLATQFHTAATSPVCHLLSHAYLSLEKSSMCDQKNIVSPVEISTCCQVS